MSERASERCGAVRVSDSNDAGYNCFEPNATRMGDRPKEARRPMRQQQTNSREADNECDFRPASVKTTMITLHLHEGDDRRRGGGLASALTQETSRPCVKEHGRKGEECLCTVVSVVCCVQ